jgi:hypothetical protein
LFTDLQPDTIVVEAPFAGRGRAFGVLVQYMAVVTMAHFEVYGYELPVAQRLQPRIVKAALGVESSKLKNKNLAHDANKRNMVEHINGLYGLNLTFSPKDKTKRTSGDDVADAIAVVHAWLHKGQTPDEPRRPAAKPNRRRARTKKAAPRRRRNGAADVED